MNAPTEDQEKSGMAPSEAVVTLCLPAGFQFRVATREDGPAVQALVFDILREYGLQPDPYGVDADLLAIDAHYFASGGWFAVLCEPSGGLVGTVGLKPVEPGVVELRKMYLAKAHRGRGLGRALLERALAEARRLGFRRIVLETATVLREAIDLYRRNGFVDQSARPCVCRCDRVMERTLT